MTATPSSCLNPIEKSTSTQQLVLLLLCDKQPHPQRHRLASLSDRSILMTKHPHFQSPPPITTINTSSFPNSDSNYLRPRHHHQCRQTCLLGDVDVEVTLVKLILQPHIEGKKEGRARETERGRQ
eukprot:3045145-Rhodomonas_salina.1